jgi:hypothetical protein
MLSMELRHKRARGLRSFGLVLAIVAGVIVLTLITQLLSAVTPYAGYLTFGVILLFALYIFKRFVVEYRYTLNEEGTFTVERLSGSRSHVLVQLELAKAQYYGLPGEAVPTVDQTRRFTLTDSENPERVLVIGKAAFHLQPNEEMDRRIAECAMSQGDKKEQAQS